jgi:hypothetical protein
MTTSRRFVTPLAAALFAASLVACGTPPATGSPTVDPSLAASAEAAARDAYTTAICPIFDAIVIVNPRIDALRDAGIEGDPEAVATEEVDSVIAELGTVLDDLEAVPAWDPGGSLRYQVLAAIHGIRARLLRVAEDPGSPTSMRTLAGLPFIASDAMDFAFAQAMQAGYACDDAGAS